MYQPAPREFSLAAAAPPRLARRWPLLLAAGGLLIAVGAGAGMYAWAQTLCGACAPPIVCAKRCTHPIPLPGPGPNGQPIQPKWTERAPLDQTAPVNAGSH